MKYRFAFITVLLVACLFALCAAADAADLFVGSSFTVEGRTIRSREARTKMTLGDQTVPVTIPLDDSYCTLAGDTVLIREDDGAWCNGEPSADTHLAIGGSGCTVTAGGSMLAPGSKVVLLETDGSLHAFSAGTGTTGNMLVVGEKLNARECIASAHLGFADKFTIPLPNLTIPWLGATIVLKNAKVTIRFDVDAEYEIVYFNVDINQFSCELDAPYVKVYNFLPVTENIPIIPIAVPLPLGFALDFTPSMSLEGSGRGTSEFSFDGDAGIHGKLKVFPGVIIPTDAGWDYSTPTVKMISTNLDGELYYGLSWGPMLSWMELISIGPTYKGGTVIRSVASKSHEEAGDVWHACDPGECFEGSAHVREGPMSVDVQVGLISYSVWDAIKAKDYSPFTYFYFSRTYGDKSINSRCPHRGYRLNVRVFAEGKPIQGATVTYPDDIEHYGEISSAVSGPDGWASIWMPEGRAMVKATISSPHTPEMKQTAQALVAKNKYTEDISLYFSLKAGWIVFRANIASPYSDIPPIMKYIPFFSRDIVLPDTVPQKTGYVFKCWNTRSDGKGRDYVPGSSIVPEDSVLLLYAQWRPMLVQDSWYIVYNANGGLKAPLGQIIPNGQDAVLTDEIAWWDSDIRFLGWSTEPDAINPQYKPGDKVPYREDVSFLMLYAVWEFPPARRPVEIRYDANGMAGATIPGKEWVEPYTWMQLGTALAPFGSNVQFLGWSTDASAAEPEYEAGETYQFSKDTVLYAVWYREPEIATLFFRDSLPGEVSGMPDDISIYPSQSARVTVPSDIPEKPGYYFTGWNTAADGSGTRYAPGTTITLKNDIIFYAQWKLAQNSWYILYDANGGMKAPLGQVIPNGQDAVLTDEIAWWDSDIRFLGWSTEPDAINPEYNPGDTVRYQKEVSSLTLYAVWEFPPVKRPVEIRFDANGVEEAEVPRKEWIEPYSWLQLKEALPPMGSEMIFLGWDTNPDARTPSCLAGEAYQFDQDTCLYAIWAKGQARATLDFKDSLPGKASNMPEAVSIYPSMSPFVMIPDNVPQKDGMIFTGWNTLKDGSGEGYAPGSTIHLTEDTVLYAQWTPLGDYWYIVYHANGGSDAPLTQIIQKGQSAVLELQRPHCSGWTFLGWSRDKNAKKPEYRPGGILPYDSSEPFVTLYAVWYRPDFRTVTVTFEANGGNAETLPDEISVPMLTWFMLPDKKPEWDPQHDFLGWDPDPGATEPSYRAGSTVMFKKDITLYAVWKPHYRIIEGAGSTWYKGSQRSHRFAADGNIAYFEAFRFDGNTLDSSDYNATSGSTVIDVSAAAMQKLTVGTHVVEVVYRDGSARAEFRVSGGIPRTGDTSDPALWAGLALLGLAGFIIIRRYAAGKKTSGQ